MPTTTTMAKYSLDDDEEEQDNMALNMNIMNDAEHKHNLDDDLGFYKDEEEQTGVGEVLFSLTKEETESFPDEQMPLRHYRAEDGNIEKAIAKLKATIQWRKEFGVKDVINCLHTSTTTTTSNNNNNNNEETTETTASNLEIYKKEELATILRKENESGKMYVRGYDKDGRAILYMRPGKENTKGEELNNLRHLVYNLERAIACSMSSSKSKTSSTSTLSSQDKICLLIDYDGFQLQRHAPPMSTSRKTLDILQNHYPERMYRVYLCNPPFLFRTFWAMIKPFVDPVTKEKICFCHGEKGIEKILQDIGDEQSKFLEPCAGGPITPSVKPFSSKEYLSLPFDQTF